MERECGHAVCGVQEESHPKYATKSETRSRSVYGNIMKDLDDDGTSLQVARKLLTNSVGDRNYSAQETCHLLLQLPMYRASRDFVILRSREVDANLDDERAVTLHSHYCARPATPQLEQLNILQFVQRY